MASNSYSPIPASFRMNTWADCTGYKGFASNLVSMSLNQSVCTLNSTRNFDAISQCCKDVNNGSLISVNGSSITFCTSSGQQFNSTAYHDCFKKIPLPNLPAGLNYTNTTAYVASELGSCGSCSAKQPVPSSAVSDFVISKVGIAVMAVCFVAMFSVL